MRIKFKTFDSQFNSRPKTMSLMRILTNLQWTRLYVILRCILRVHFKKQSQHTGQSSIRLFERLRTRFLFYIRLCPLLPDGVGLSFQNRCAVSFVHLDRIQLIAQHSGAGELDLLRRRLERRELTLVPACDAYACVVTRVVCHCCDMPRCLSSIPHISFRSPA